MKKRVRYLRRLKTANAPHHTDEWSVMEGSEAFEALIGEAGRRAATNAVNENRALGIPVTFTKDGWVVRRMPDGHIERIKPIEGATGPIRERKLRKGMILHVKKATR
ncbi:hypothetical protein GFS24_26770 [Chitinophaga sp. SYP-B3965]|uniref:hypothetical protein n=1 Tax=Chitinophaga sp. SYP-B3965 TaxID=2663120 RepID=UPI0012995D44|nr:hypothetical protein [Chitinophaga sp. SYP-B3965]MRG48744.1 hypothetical protein [Chitinophaga sp. SYP-B3965]